MQATALFQLMETGDGQGMFNFVTKQNRPSIVNEAIKQWNPKLHPVANKTQRPDKPIFVPTSQKDERGNTIMRASTAPVTRAPLMLQKYIISQKSSFARGNGVVLKPTDEQSNIFTRVSSNWINNKTDFDLKELAERKMAETQVAVIFYGEKGAQSFDEFNFKYKIVSPIKGDTLYPYFDDDTDALIGFGREYERGDEKRFDLYLMNQGSGLCEIWRYLNGKPIMIEVKVDKEQEDIISAVSTEIHQVTKTTYTKLPIVYWEQDAGECNDTDEITQELESGFSDFLTGLGYTADPILFGKGKAMDLPAKGVAGKFIETDDPAGDLKYLTPDNATEARALQFNLLLKYIMTLNRAVMLDIDTLKGLGSGLSGAALERFLIDVYMEATNKQQGSWGKGVQRMVNWLVSQWQELEGNTDKTFRIDVVFSKYSLQDELEKVTLAMKANGNKPVVDIETSIAIANLVDDPKITMGKIKAETVIPPSNNPNQVITPTV